MTPPNVDMPNESDIEETWSVLSADERAEAFSLLGREEAQDFFLKISVDDRAQIIQRLPEGEKRLWIRLLAPDDAADLIQHSAKEDRQALLSLLDDQNRREVNVLLTYKQDVAGGLMNPHFARVPPDLTADEAIRYLRLQVQKHLENIYYIYVLDEAQKLLGVVSFRDLFKATPDKKIRDIMKTEVIAATENQDQEAVAKYFSKHKFFALPVVDEFYRLKGIITSDDILHAVQDEATEDIQKLGGVQALDKPYIQMGFWEMLKKRGVWLSVLFMGEMLTATAMAHYEEEIARAVVLALFVPLIISSGGNSGSQASTLVIRAMALGEFQLKDWWRIVRREAAVGLGLGLILAVLGFGRIVFAEYFFHSYGDYSMLIGAAVAVSLVGVVMWGTLVGSLLPFVLRKLNFDPASASAPFVATLVDVFGIVIYFSISALFLRGTLL